MKYCKNYKHWKVKKIALHDIHDVIFSWETIETSGKKQPKFFFFAISAFTFYRNDYELDIIGYNESNL